MIPGAVNRCEALAGAENREGSSDPEVVVADAAEVRVHRSTGPTANASVTVGAHRRAEQQR
jgi:hypothetical protein